MARNYIPPYTRLIDFDGFYTYIGEADVGSLTYSPVWRIKRVETHANDADMKIIWAGSSAEFNKTWNDRLTYDYT